MIRRLTKQQETDLLEQIKTLYCWWTCGAMNTDSGQAHLNGLWNIAKKIDPAGMAEAFNDGLAKIKHNGGKRWDES